MEFLNRILSGGVAEIGAEEAYRRLQGDAAPLMVDVRQVFEARSGGVPGAVNIPLTEIGRRLAELPRERPILVICRSGHRSPLAARQLKRAGYDVTHVAGGTMAWQAAGLPLTPPGDERR